MQNKHFILGRISSSNVGQMVCPKKTLLSQKPDAGNTV